MSFASKILAGGYLPSEIVAQHLITAPVNVERIADRLGIRVVFEQLTDCAGKIEHDYAGYKITVNAGDFPARQRFTIAHEIGHYMLHRSLIGDGITDDVMYRSKLGGYHEAQANSYAAYILMPPNLFKRKYREGITETVALAALFGVSKMAAQIRIEELDLAR